MTLYKETKKQCTVCHVTGNACLLVHSSTWMPQMVALDGCPCVQYAYVPTSFQHVDASDGSVRRVSVCPVCLHTYSTYFIPALGMPRMVALDGCPCVQYAYVSTVPTSFQHLGCLGW